MNKLKIIGTVAAYLCFNFLTSGQSQNDFHELLKEIEWYIHKTKPYVSQDGVHDVFLVRIQNEAPHEYSMTVGIVSDSVHYSSLYGFNHYKWISNNLILFSFSAETNYESLGLSLIKDRKMILERFISGVVFFSQYPGYVCTYEKGNIARIYYLNSDKIPYDKKIFRHIPQGETIKVDSTEIRRRFKK